MIELRWVFHDLKTGAPPLGSICVGDLLFQKLQYRVTEDEVTDWKDCFDWEDVPIAKGKK